MMNRITALLTLFVSGLFGQRNTPPTVPVAPGAAPAHARAYAPRYGTCPVRRSYGLPTFPGMGAGFWDAREPARDWDAVRRGQEREAAKRRTRDATRILNNARSAMGAHLAKVRIERESDAGASRRRAGGIVHFDMAPPEGWYPAPRAAWLGILPSGAQA